MGRSFGLYITVYDLEMTDGDQSDQHNLHNYDPKGEF